jgi:hypothetical protein
MGIIRTSIAITASRERYYYRNSKRPLDHSPTKEEAVKTSFGDGRLPSVRCHASKLAGHLPQTQLSPKKKKKKKKGSLATLFFS